MLILFLLYILFFKAVGGTYTSAPHSSDGMLVQAHLDNRGMLEEVRTALVHYSISYL